MPEVIILSIESGQTKVHRVNMDGHPELVCAVLNDIQSQVSTGQRPWTIITESDAIDPDRINQIARSLTPPKKHRKKEEGTS